MRVRGRRRCRECGRGWSYFETGSPACPDCGSLWSVAVDEEPALHTDDPAALDLETARAKMADGSLREVARDARPAARDYLRSRGFVRGGELLPLDSAVLAAAELAHACDHLRRSMEPADATEAYFLALLAGAEDGERPATVPDDVRWVRGLAAAEAVGAYRRDVVRWLDGDAHPEVRPLLDRLRSHERRIEALDGHVLPGEAEALVKAARDLGRYLREGDGSALGGAEAHLSLLE